MYAGISVLKLHMTSPPYLTKCSQSAELALKPLTAMPGNDHPRLSHEYMIQRGGDGTRYD